MAKHKVSVVGLFLLIPIFLFSQDRGKVIGKVENSTGKPLKYVNISLLNTQRGGVTGEDGKYIIEGIKPGEYQVKTSSVGYHAKRKSITIQPNETVTLDFELNETAIQMEEMVVTGTMQSSYVKESPVKVEVLNEKFLESDPTNNVMEAIDNVNGIQKQSNCGVCGTNSIRINGMEGPYTLLLIDGMPIMSNLASVYGFNGIPNSIVKQIEVIKGPNSTLYGSQAMAGVINVRTKEPEDMPLISANSYYTSHNEWNVDLSVSPDIGENVHTTFSTNYFRNQKKYDFNDDNFTDLVLNNRLSLFNKWQFDRENGKEANIAGRYYKESRLGGTIPFTHGLRGSDSIYGESIKTERFSIIGNYGLPIPGQNVRLDFSYSKHKQDSYYGTEYYKADQSTLFANLIWSKELGDHNLLTGLTGKYEQYEDNSPAKTGFSSFVPGVFVQDEWTVTESISLLSGLRYDQHEEHGAIISPRLNMKYELGKWTTARINLGSGFRQVHLFTEDHAALTGSRDVVIREKLQPEESYNVAFNLNHVYQAGKYGTGSIDFDLFYTYFMNKITPDYDIDPNLVVYKNLDGYGISRGASATVGHDFKFPLTVKFGGTYQQAFEVIETNGEEERKEIDFTPVFSGNFSAEYQIRPWNVSLTYTGSLVGPQDLPQFEPPFSRPEESSWYSIQNLKVAKTIGHNWQIYGGVKNILNWTQPTPLIDPENPFSDHFDTIYAYGPLQPRRVYVGLKWHLDKE